MVIIMVEVRERQTKFSEKPFHKPMNIAHEERDLSGLKKRYGSARDYIIFVGTKNPLLWMPDARSMFIKACQEAGCSLPERSIDRAIRQVKSFMRSVGVDVYDDGHDTMEADHRMYFGGDKDDALEG